MWHSDTCTLTTSSIHTTAGECPTDTPFNKSRKALHGKVGEEMHHAVIKGGKRIPNSLFSLLENHCCVYSSPIRNTRHYKATGTTYMMLFVSIFTLRSAPSAVINLAHDPFHALLKPFPILGRCRLDEPCTVPNGMQIQPSRDLSEKIIREKIRPVDPCPHREGGGGGSGDMSNDGVHTGDESTTAE